LGGPLISRKNSGRASTSNVIRGMADLAVEEQAAKVAREASR